MNYVYTREGETIINVDAVSDLGEAIEFTKEDLLIMLHEVEQYENTEGVFSLDEVIKMNE